MVAVVSGRDILNSSQRFSTARWSASEVSICGISRGVVEVTT
jgi:hypothetical protein